VKSLPTYGMREASSSHPLAVNKLGNHRRLIVRDAQSSLSTFSVAMNELHALAFCRFIEQHCQKTVRRSS
jgi:hypothetical protein